MQLSMLGRRRRRSFRVAGPHILEGPYMASVSPAGPTWRAACSCGWRSSRCESADATTTASDHHLADIARRQARSL